MVLKRRTTVHVRGSECLCCRRISEYELAVPGNLRQVPAYSADSRSSHDEEVRDLTSTLSTIYRETSKLLPSRYVERVDSINAGVNGIILLSCATIESKF